VQGTHQLDTEYLKQIGQVDRAPVWHEIGRKRIEENKDQS
jgi:hypothetical protein